LVCISKFTRFDWKQKFEEEAPVGLWDKPNGTPTSNGLPELNKRAILMVKQANPDWGCQRSSDMLLCGRRLVDLLRA
jgi:hypothetical protein